MNKKNLIIFLALLLLLIVTGYWGYNQYQEKNQLQVYLGNRYQQAFYELVENVEQIQVLLGKSLVSSSPERNIVTLADIWKKSTDAQEELNKLPISTSIIYRTAKFLSQTGDFAHVLSRKNSSGEVLNEKDRKTLVELKKQAVKLNTSLYELENDVLSRKANWMELIQGAKRTLKKEAPNLLQDGFNDIKKDLEQYPTLIYDGPFSDHIVEAKSKVLKTKKIDIDEAKDRAIRYLRYENIDDFDISQGREVKGKIPAYSFTIEDKEKGKFTVDISKNGGFVLNILNSRKSDSKNINEKEAAEKAEEYLAKINYPNMEATYIEASENIAFVSLAYMPNDIIYYPDIINVQIPLDNGQILGVSALNYLDSHEKRDIKRAVISENTAKELVGRRLEIIEEAKLALIPKDNLEEILSYEIRGKIGEEIYLVYINAYNGIEEQILKLVKNDQGIFAI